MNALISKKESAQLRSPILGWEVCDSPAMGSLRTLQRLALVTGEETTTILYSSARKCSAAGLLN
jgi:hypothetical protein